MKRSQLPPYRQVINRQVEALRGIAHEMAQAASPRALAKRLPKNPQSDLLFEISNQALHASTDEPASLLESFKLLISPGSEKQPRTRALIQITHRFLPKLTTHYAHRTVNRVNKLSPNQPRLIAHGTAHNVFLISIKGKQYALKVNVHSQRIKSDLARHNLLENIQTDAAKVHSWFGHIPGFLPHQTVTILKSPPMNRPAVVTIQPYIDGEKIDFFSLSQNQLFRLFQQKPYLKTIFVAFASSLNRLLRHTREAPELAGDGNLVFVSKPKAKTKLMLLDANYVITPARSRSWHRPARSLHYARIRYLQKLAKHIKTQTA